MFCKLVEEKFFEEVHNFEDRKPGTIQTMDDIAASCFSLS